jgi:hypothetical protein
MRKREEDLNSASHDNRSLTRDVATSVLSQHFKKGFLTHGSNAIGFGQGGSSLAAPILLRQVQNYATHGMAGLGIVDLRHCLTG